ncbi:MAG TPA: hypothetical protein VJQ57_13880 [Acidimicrobiia bacterium]|nr:hypothetical protein [Acidimicrobiia bacterium]
MTRLPGPGRDFDDQWNESRRKGQERAARGEGPWAADAKLEALRQSYDASGGDSGPKHAKPSSDSCVTALGVLGGLAWAITETIRHLT